MYPLRSVIWVIRSEVIIWVGHAARMTEKELHTGFKRRNLRKSDLRVDGCIILKWVLKSRLWVLGLVSSGSG